MLPDFIIIGAMKGGTSSLYHYIATHPDIVRSSVKETDFFTADKFNKGLSWYESLYKNNSQYAFEASPNYTKRHLFPNVAERMHSLLPEIKLIYVLRDPIERVISHYIHSYAEGSESRTFAEVVKDTNSNYVQTSKYYFQLRAFLGYYADKNVLLIESEKLSKDPAKVLSDVFEFLGISPEYDAAMLETRFHESSVKYRYSFWERELSNKITNRHLLAGIQKIGKPFRKSIERPHVSSAEKEILAAEIAPDLEKLRRFSGLDFSDWSL